jgi:hypothetical protein
MMCRAQEHEASVYEGMRSLTAYFGEDWDANDPSRVLRVVRDFMDLFGKAHREIEVSVFSRACDGASYPAACLQRLALSANCACSFVGTCGHPERRASRRFLLPGTAWEASRASAVTSCA